VCVCAAVIEGKDILLPVPLALPPAVCRDRFSALSDLILSACVVLASQKHIILFLRSQHNTGIRNSITVLDLNVDVELFGNARSLESGCVFIAKDF